YKSPVEMLKLANFNLKFSHLSRTSRDDIACFFPYLLLVSLGESSSCHHSLLSASKKSVSLAKLTNISRFLNLESL
ncbi:hypothetical protein EA438_08320, partial [Streptococcus dysgalactiae subsp. dysgalactiae]|nr:hypothetical protein [Streptococcus dysgalactiae subsp. dysgalactiae]